MSDPDAPCVSLGAHPEPVCQYEIREGTPTVSATNDAFDAAVGVAPGAPVTAVFERFETVDAGGEAPTARLRAGEAVELARDDDAYVARVLAPGPEGGTIVFADREDATPAEDAVGVDRVASAIGHDLRNPLDVAGAHLEAARETGDAEHFDAVADAHDRMERIIQDVLTLARGEAALHTEPGADLRATAERAWGSVETDGRTLHLDESLPTATADPDRLRRLFENLFRNAVEHGASAGTVRVGTLAEGTGVFVADDGPGIPPGERSAVLTPGYTVDGDGTGLGLAIVDRIAAAHGWAVAVAGSESGGTRVEIRFDGGT